MKDHGSKPVGRRKSMAEAPSAQFREKVEGNETKCSSNSKHLDSTQQQERISGLHEHSKLAAHRCENENRQVLPDRARPCLGNKAISRQAGPEKPSSRTYGVEKSGHKPKSDLASRCEDKFPHRLPVSQDIANGVGNKLSQRPNRKEECLTNYSSPEISISRPSGSRETIIKLSTHERSGQQESQKRLQHERQVKDHQQKIKGNQLDKALDTRGKGQPHHKQPVPLRDKISKKTEQGHRGGILRNGLINIHEKREAISYPDGRENLPAQIQRPKSHIIDPTPGIHDNPKLPSDEIGAEGQEISRLQRHPREFQEPRERSAQSQRHQPHISETHSSHERASFQRQHPPERLLSAHEHETKLIQRQQYLQEKVRSRKMLLGSVIPSDMTFLSEACRNWQSATMLSYRCMQEKSYKHAVLSGDSGVSMGEGSSASRRNSETETDDQAKDDLPTIVAEVGEIISRRVPSKCQKCQRNRCEMKDASSQHSHPPSETETPPSSPFTETISPDKIDSAALDVMSPPPRDRVYQCRVIRDKNTYGTMFYPVYRMYLERDGRAEMLLLTARKRKKCSTSKYLICTGNDELRRKSSSLVGKLRSNLVGTRFHLATYVRGAEPEGGDSRPDSPLKLDSLLLFYETNFLGTKGPRRMKVFLPEVGRADGQTNLLDRVQDGSMEGVLTLVNKEPEWDRETLSHILYFEGRVTKSSVKNFQLVRPQDESSVLLQFGKIGRNEFTLDYHPPINAVQAFAIALSSFDGKIACE